MLVELLDIVDAAYGFGIAGIATHPVKRIGWINDHTTGAERVYCLINNAGVPVVFSNDHFKNLLESGNILDVRSFYPQDNETLLSSKL